MAKVNVDPGLRLDITCRRGDTFILNTYVNDLDGNPIDTTQFTFKTEVRAYPGSDDIIITDDLFSYETGVDGMLRITVPAADMEVDAGVYAYDVQATDDVSFIVMTWLYGMFTVNQDITQ
jgi:hypothetical protein